jgi:hypothetical protein
MSGCARAPGYGYRQKSLNRRSRQRGISARLMTASGQILPPRNVRGMSVIPPEAAVNADISVRPVRARR